MSKTMSPFGAELKSKNRWSRIALLLIFPVLAHLNLASAWGFQAPVNTQKDLETLRQLEEQYLRAEVEDDATIAGSILADDYVGLKGDGTTLTKADVLGRLGQHERRRQPYQVTATAMHEYLFGDSACVTYTKVYTKPGSQAAYSENVLHMLSRRNGIWRLQLSSPLPAARQ
jgi:hypothetical protein